MGERRGADRIVLPGQGAFADCARGLAGVAGSGTGSRHRDGEWRAGGGIVADSEPLAELAETQSKFQAMLSAIVRP